MVVLSGGAWARYNACWMVWEDRPFTGEANLMAAIVEAPRELVEAVAALRLPPKADRRLQELMDRNTNGCLSTAEREGDGSTG